MYSIASVVTSQDKNDIEYDRGGSFTRKWRWENMKEIIKDDQGVNSWMKNERVGKQQKRSKEDEEADKKKQKEIRKNRDRNSDKWKKLRNK